MNGFMFTPDEPSFQYAGYGWCIIFWYGSVKQWGFGYEHVARHQEPHKRFDVGPISVQWPA